MAGIAVSEPQLYRTSESFTELRATLEWNLISRRSQYQLDEVCRTSESVARIPSKVKWHSNGGPDG
jgi:hypothetical protein